MSGQEAYYLELQVAMQACELAGDIEGAEHYQQMMDELAENWEDEE